MLLFVLSKIISVCAKLFYFLARLKSETKGKRLAAQHLGGKPLKQTKMVELVSRYITDNTARLYRLAYSYVKNEQDAMDIVQDVAYKLLKDAGKIKHPEYMDTLLYRATVNMSLDFLRKHKRETIGLPKEEKGREDDHGRLYILDVLNILEENSRTIVLLRYFEDKPLTEIAEIMQMNLNTVKTKLYKALRLLHKALEGEEGDGHVQV